MKSILILIKRLYNWVLGWSEHKWGVPALCTISFAEASFFPIPPDVLLIAMGAGKPRKAFIYAAWTTLFSILGALFGYWIGATLWEYISEYFFTYVFPEDKFNLVSERFHGSTLLVMIIAGFTPIPFKIFTIVAGVLHAPLMPFILGSTIARSARFFLLGSIFYFLGEKAKIFIDKNFEKLTILLGIVLIISVLMYKLI